LPAASGAHEEKEEKMTEAFKRMCLAAFAMFTFVAIALAIMAPSIAHAANGAVQIIVTQATAEEQLAGCPANLEYKTAANGNWLMLQTRIERSCWRALNGSQNGDNEDSSDDDC